MIRFSALSDFEINDSQTFDFDKHVKNMPQKSIFRESRISSYEKAT